MIIINYSYELCAIQYIVHRDDVLIDIMTYFPQFLTSSAYFWRYYVLFDITTYFLISWRIYFLLEAMAYFWYHDVICDYQA